jgi:hypothetical protein
VSEELLAAFGEQETAARALEQFKSEFMLEAADLP